MGAEHPAHPAHPQLLGVRGALQQHGQAAGVAGGGQGVPLGPGWGPQGPGVQQGPMGGAWGAPGVPVHTPWVSVGLGAGGQWGSGDGVQGMGLVARPERSPWFDEDGLMAHLPNPTKHGWVAGLGEGCAGCLPGAWGGDHKGGQRCPVVAYPM